MRFSLSETVANVVAPIAIDSGGQFIYLITNSGLTVVSLGEALLSIGHITPSSTAVGSQAAAVDFTDQNTLTLTIPALSSGPQDFVLTNVDGSSYTLENEITVQ
jgi:hypothetical protein